MILKIFSDKQMLTDRKCKLRLWLPFWEILLPVNVFHVSELLHDNLLASARQTCLSCALKCTKTSENYGLHGDVDVPG